MSYDHEPTIGYGTRERTVVPAGYYDAQIVGVYYVGRHFDNYYQKYQSVVKIKMELPVKDKYERNVQLIQDFNATMGPKARLRALAQACKGGEISDDEASKFRLSDFKGQHCMVCVSVVPLKDNPDEKRNKITAIVPPRLPGYQSENPIEFWDFRISDPDEAPNWIWELYQKSADYKPPAKPRVPKPVGNLATAADEAQKPKASIPDSWQVAGSAMADAAVASDPAPAPVVESGGKFPWE